MISSDSADPMYAITLPQPRALPIALGIKTVETRPSPAPAHFDELDKQQAGALITTLRRHGHLPANHSLGGRPPKRRSADGCCAIASGGDNAIWVEHAVRGGRAVTAADAQRGGRP